MSFWIDADRGGSLGRRAQLRHQRRRHACSCGCDRAGIACPVVLPRSRVLLPRLVRHRRHSGAQRGPRGCLATSAREAQAPVARRPAVHDGGDRGRGGQRGNRLGAGRGLRPGVPRDAVADRPLPGGDRLGDGQAAASRDHVARAAARGGARRSGSGGSALPVILYIAPKLGRSSELYGTLGSATVVLLWLYLVARLIVAGVPERNARSGA